MLLTSSSYLAPVQVYAHLYAATEIVEDRYEHFVKQTYRNRCYIASANGPQALTIPVERNGRSHTAMRDIRISDHGNWRHLHWTAIRSAYDSSPYFFYYADDFAPLYERRFDFLVDFNEALQHLVLSLLSLEAKRPRLSDAYIEQPRPEDIDLRFAGPKAPAEADPHFHAEPYYQVFGERLGFLPNLSIIDLLFNHGPESRLIILKCLK